MTREQWAKLSPEEKRIKVAELCGITSIHEADRENRGMARMAHRLGYDLFGLRNGQFAIVPDYLNDLNAMHEAEKVLQERFGLMLRYTSWLQFVVLGKWEKEEAIQEGRLSRYKVYFATAAQRAEAFVLTMEEAE